MMGLGHRNHLPRAAGPLGALILAVLVMALSGVSGCDRSAVGTVPDEPAPRGTNGSHGDDANAAGDGLAVDGEDGHEVGGENGASTPCESIEECPSYLSCIDHICQEPPAVTGEHTDVTPAVTFFVDEGNGQEVASFYVELAITPAEQEKGLMFRREMKDDWGMLFIYPDEGVRSFWMENTFISLDMVFIDGAGRIVHILEEVEPLTRTRRRSQGPARYVLELNAGRASQVGLSPGQRMQLDNVDEEHRPQP